MSSSSRNSMIASLLESFLDENEDDLSPNMFKALDDLAGEIDGLVKDKDDEIEELNDRIDELERELNDIQ